MCKKAVVGENIENNDAEYKGIKDYSFSLFNLHISSVRVGIRLIVALIIIYNIIRHSNMKNWTRIFNCILPCCSQTWSHSIPEQRNPDNAYHFQNNNKTHKNSRRYQWALPKQHSPVRSFERGDLYESPNMWPYGTP